MIMSVYLHDEVASVLKCYGSLDDVINRILDAASDGKFDLEDKPEAPGREGASRYLIDIRNREYLDLHRIYKNSPRISLRRLLYWFVENEMYDILGWKAVREYTDKITEKRKKFIGKARQSLELLATVMYGNSYDVVIQAMELINSLEV